MKSSRLRRLVIPAGVIVGLAGLAAVVATATAGAANGRTPLPGTKPGWTAQATPTSTVAASQTEAAKVWLAPQNANALATLAKTVSDPSSAQYRQYLTHAQYVAQYAPTSATVSAVTKWLKQSGLTVTSVGVDNHYVAVTGPASAMTSAFGAKLGVYSANGTQVAPTSDFSVPSSVASSVLGITGLATLGHEVSALGVARTLAPVAGAFLLDEADRELAPAIEALGLRVACAPTLMTDVEARRRLAEAALALVA